MRQPEYMVVALYDTLEPSLPRWFEAHREGREAWRIVWTHRQKVPGPLGDWFRALDAGGREPQEVVLLSGLGRYAAQRLVAFLVSETSRMAGCSPGEVSDFLCNTIPRNTGKAGRPVIVVDPSGNVEVFPSVAAWSRKDGVDRTSRIFRGIGPRGRVAL